MTQILLDSLIFSPQNRLDETECLVPTLVSTQTFFHSLAPWYIQKCLVQRERDWIIVSSSPTAQFATKISFFSSELSPDFINQMLQKVSRFVTSVRRRGGISVVSSSRTNSFEHGEERELRLDDEEKEEDPQHRFTKLLLSCPFLEEIALENVTSEAEEASQIIFTLSHIIRNHSSAIARSSAAFNFVKLLMNTTPSLTQELFGEYEEEEHFISDLFKSIINEVFIPTVEKSQNIQIKSKVMSNIFEFADAILILMECIAMTSINDNFLSSTSMSADEGELIHKIVKPLVSCVLHPIFTCLRDNIFSAGGAKLMPSVSSYRHLLVFMHTFSRFVGTNSVSAKFEMFFPLWLEFRYSLIVPVLHETPLVTDVDEEELQFGTCYQPNDDDGDDDDDKNIDVHSLLSATKGKNKRTWPIGKPQIKPEYVQLTTNWLGIWKCLGANSWIWEHQKIDDDDFNNDDDHTSSSRSDHLTDLVNRINDRFTQPAGGGGGGGGGRFMMIAWISSSDRGKILRGMMTTAEPPAPTNNSNKKKGTKRTFNISGAATTSSSSKIITEKNSNKPATFTPAHFAQVPFKRIYDVWQFLLKSVSARRVDSRGQHLRFADLAKCVDDDVADDFLSENINPDLQLIFSSILYQVRAMINEYEAADCSRRFEQEIFEEFVLSEIQQQRRKASGNTLKKNIDEHNNDDNDKNDADDDQQFIDSIVNNEKHLPIILQTKEAFCVYVQPILSDLVFRDRRLTSIHQHVMSLFRMFVFSDNNTSKDEDDQKNDELLLIRFKKQWSDKMQQVFRQRFVECEIPEFWKNYVEYMEQSRRYASDWKMYRVLKEEVDKMCRDCVAVAL